MVFRRGGSTQPHGSGHHSHRTETGGDPPETIALEQIRALIQDAERCRDYESRRDAALLRIFACTGGRLSELCRLQVDDIDQQTRKIKVRGKNGKTRVIKYDHKCGIAIDRYVRARTKHPHSYLPGLWLGIRRSQAMTPSGIRQVIERRGQRLGIKLWPHLFDTPSRTSGLPTVATRENCAR